jgi:hypothetical protein
MVETDGAEWNVGAMFPIIEKNNPSLKIPSWAFFFARYFGSGIIVATAFIHVGFFFFSFVIFLFVGDGADVWW